MNPLLPLRGEQAFQEVRSRGKCAEGKYFRFLFLCRHAKGFFPSMGVVVYKRFGSAVQRNLIRRRVREAFRSVLSAQSAKLKELDMSISTVVIYKGVKGLPFGQIPFEHIKREIALVFEQL